MDLYSLYKFKKYKNDWNYPIQVRCQEKWKANKEKKDKNSITFQSAIKQTLIVGQCFGLNPVLGIRQDNALKLRFTYKSWRCAYTFVTMLGQLGMATLLFISLFKETLSTVDSATALLFYFFGFLTTLQFLRIAIFWPKLSVLIAKMEAADPNTDTKLKRKFNIANIVILSLAFMEYCFSELHSLSNVLDCDPQKPIFETFTRNSYSWAFTYLPYDHFLGVLLHLINLQRTFNWNYADLFVICMSMYLTSRLEQVNQRILAAKDKNSPILFWRSMREEYNRAVYLVRQVDKIIGGVVFTSFASNLFFVCAQLLHTLAGGIKASPRCRPDTGSDNRIFDGYEHSIYFAYSFLFLLARALAVSLTAAKVNAASLEPVHSLYDLSSATYCVEVERLMNQIHGDTVALTGLQFFQVKRGLVLTIAGTIITYELVLIQFTGITPAAKEVT